MLKIHCGKKVLGTPTDPLHVDGLGALKVSQQDGHAVNPTCETCLNGWASHGGVGML
jgi:hypothetical protein